MSKNIVIQEGGLGKQLTADKLKTNLVGGGTCLWVPEEDVQLGTKYISENGTYQASADGYYGYSEVTVSGVGTATGKDPDGSGDDAVATVDPETGQIVITKQPSSIEVITPPTNPYGTYMDGQTITKDGMVVKAYSANGDEMQTVPIGEITINPTTAVYNDATDEIVVPEDNPYDLPGFSFKRGHISGTRYTDVILSFYGDLVFLCVENGDVCDVIIASDHPVSSTSFTYSTTGTTNWNRITQSTSYTENGKTVYLATIVNNNGTGALYKAPYPVEPVTINDKLKSAWVAVYGYGDSPIGSRQTITVSWPRPGDGKVLTATFDILVGPRAGSGED